MKILHVAKLAERKTLHETRFQQAGEKIAASLVDSTDSQGLSYAENMKRLDTVLGWNHSETELAHSLSIFRGHVEILRDVRARTHQFIAQVSQRIYKLRNQPVVCTQEGTYIIGPHDIEQAFGLSGDTIKDYGEERKQYNLGRIHENDYYGPMKYVVVLSSVEGWPIWRDLAEFYHKTGIEISTFWLDLDFCELDE